MRHDIHSQRILIIDFGSQYTQLIARCVRDLKVYSEIFSADVDPALIESFAPNGIILSGGPDSATFDSSLNVPYQVFELGCPVLGICYGMQMMVKQLGGQVAHGHKKEFGYAEVEIIQAPPLLSDIEDKVLANGSSGLDVWMSHGDCVSVLPSSFSIVAKTQHCPIAAIADIQRQFYGLQFHPEVTHTRQGKRILSRFVHQICGCDNEWTTKHIIDHHIQAISDKLGNDSVLLALSGGVDSSVVAALLHKAVTQQLVCLFVDTGLLRLNETEDMKRIFGQHFHMQLIVIDARTRFIHALKGVEDPEEKRRIIGEQFIRVFEEEAKKRSDIRWLAQGTIYTDVIESAHTSSRAHVIKSHHNVGGLPKDIALSLIEPLRELFKDEVRQMGSELGLPSELVNRHPFPGPGLAVRIIGEVRAEYVTILQHADAIYVEELRLAGLYDRVSQAFAVFLPIKTVGVKGDARCYGYVIALRSVTTVDFMTAHWSDLPKAFLAQVSRRIINEIPEVARVVYDISDKPPSTIEWE